MWGSAWALFPPLFLRMFWVLVRPSQWGSFVGCGGGSVGVALGSFVLRASGGRYYLVRLCSPWSPLPPPLFFFCSPSLPAVLVVSGSPWSMTRFFPGGGLCRRFWGVFSFSLSVAAWPWWSAFSGWASSGRAGWSLGVLSVGPVGVARGVAWLYGGLPARRNGCVASWLCGRLSCFPPLPLAGGCALVGWRGLHGCFLLVGGWGFAPSLLFFF